MTNALLPGPREELAGCVWLPRILEKARRLDRGELPPDYVARFCHPGGVDGVFLSHFALSREEIVRAAAQTDDEVAHWFRARTGSNATAIAAWNELASNLGRPGFPMADRLPMALATSYAHLAGRGLTSVFDVLEADERMA